MRTASPSRSPAAKLSTPALHCTCLVVRSLPRTTSPLYGDVRTPSGLKSAQFSVWLHAGVMCPHTPRKATFCQALTLCRQAQDQVRHWCGEDKIAASEHLTDTRLPRLPHLPHLPHLAYLQEAA